MSLSSLGKITVVTAGTPVQISPTTVNCNIVFFQALPSQTGAQMYIGTIGMVKTGLVNVLQVLEKVAASVPLDEWTLQSNISTGPFDLSALYIDADNSGDALLVSYFSA